MTTAISVSGALNELGYEVRLVDADPQGTATERVGFRDLYDRKIPSLHQVIGRSLADERTERHRP